MLVPQRLAALQGVEKSLYDPEKPLKWGQPEPSRGLHAKLPPTHGHRFVESPKNHPPGFARRPGSPSQCVRVRPGPASKSQSWKRCVRKTLLCDQTKTHRQCFCHTHRALTCRCSHRCAGAQVQAEPMARCPLWCNGLRCGFGWPAPACGG